MPERFDLTIKEMLEDEKIGLPIVRAVVDQGMGSVKSLVVQELPSPNFQSNVERLSIHTFGALIVLAVKPWKDAEYWIPIEQVIEIHQTY